MQKYATIYNKKPETLQQLLQRAAPIVWKGKAAEKTMCRNVEEAIEIMGNPKLHEINTDMIDQYKQIIRGHLAPATVNYKMINLHRILKFAYEREWMPKMPKFEYLQVSNERERVISEEEIKNLLAWIRDNGDPVKADFFEILYLTGMRAGELMKAQRSQLEGNWLKLKARDTKTKKARNVPLNPRAKELLELRLPFKISKTAYHKAWTKARVALGLDTDPEFVVHVLRHTRATTSLQKTRNLAVVQKLLGHSNIKTTQRYAKVLDDDLLEAVV